MSQYLVLPHLSVQSANALSAYWVVNGPAVSAAVAFGHALARAIDRLEELEAVALIHHHSELQADAGSYDSLLQQRRGSGLINKKDYSGSGKSPRLSLQPTASYHLRLTLVLKFNQEADELDLTEVAAFLNQSRFAGGQIIHFHTPIWLKDFKRLQQQLKTGFVVMDARQLIESQPNQNPSNLLLNALDQQSPYYQHKVAFWLAQFSTLAQSPALDANSHAAIQQAIKTLTNEPAEGKANPTKPKALPYLQKALKGLEAWQTSASQQSSAATLSEPLNQLVLKLADEIRQHTWLSATTLGYSLLETPQQRIGARHDYPHACAEPLVGLVRYQSLAYFRTQPRQLTKIFWQERWADSGTYLLQQPNP